MTMFEVVGVGTDWIELKRQKEEARKQKTVGFGLG